MTLEEIKAIIDQSLYADLGYIDASGRPAVCRFFSVWHKGIGRHLFSSQTRFIHSQCLMEGGDACLYFWDEASFASVTLFGRAWVTYEHDKKARLWYEGDEQYFPEGVDDPKYCVIEFAADSLTYYREDGKAAVPGAEIAAFDEGSEYENGYARTHPEEA